MFKKRIVRGDNHSSLSINLMEKNSLSINLMEKKVVAHVFVYVFVLFSLLVFMNLASASFVVGNGTEIEKNYALGEKLKGQLNISFQNEAADSLISSNFDGSIVLAEFLNENGADYDCVPSDCEKEYLPSSEASTKTISIQSGQSKVFGFKLQGKIKGINSLKFDIESSARSSCIVPLKIDVLNDEEENWQFNKASNEFGCNALKGACFSNSIQEIELDEGARCEKINLINRPAYRIGAWVRKKGSANLTAYLYSSDELESPIDRCNLPDASESGGEISCVVNKSIESGEYYICISADRDSNYTIQFEQTDETCGFYDINSFSESQEYNSDYNVFAKPAEYADVGKFTFNNSLFSSSEEQTLEEYIWNYIDNKYEGNCQNGCVIPMKVEVGATQDLTISNVFLNYDTDIKNSKTSNYVYTLTETSAKINSDFVMLDLEYSNITLSGSYGAQDLKLYLGGSLISSENISITESLINFVTPLIAYAAVPTTFTANISANKSIASYKWDFGDENEETTTTNSVAHTYSDTGAYTLKLSVEDKNGAKSSKDFKISVGNPKDIVDSTLKEYKARIENLTKQIADVPLWIKPLIEKQINLNSTKSELESLEEEFKSASTDEEYIGIMSDLAELEVPKYLQARENSEDFFSNSETINPIYLTELATKVEKPEDYKEAIAGWSNENLELKVTRKIYNLYYDKKVVSAASVFVLKIKPKQDFAQEIYLIIDENYDEIIFKEEYNEKAVKEATAITFSELEQDKEKTIEFALPEKIEILELPVYISPDFSQLETGEISPCNSDKKCEKDSGETNENCPSDCKPWWKITKYLLILLFASFVVYIILQEWYKRYYERSLFKDKNELFNLISFVSNTLHQEFSKKDIVKRLEGYGWSGEQIIYAFKKATGKRTGMWEIPIFRPFEKRKIKKEIEKRKQFGAKPPTPMRFPFVK